MGRLFWKFFLAFWLALLLASIGAGTAVWLRHQVETGNDEIAGPLNEAIDIKHAASLLQVAELANRYGGSEELRSFLDKLRSSHLPAVYAVDDEGNEILKRKPDPKAVQQARSLFLNGNNPDAVRLVSTKDGNRYLLFLPVFKHGIVMHPPHNSSGNDAHQRFTIIPPPPIPMQDGTGLPELLGPTASSQQHGHHGRFDHSAQRSELLPVLSGFFASLAFSFALAWYFAKPIRRLRQAIASLACGNLDVRVADAMGKRRDELSDLGRDFDHMAEQINHLVHAQQRLLHDVSHELRSPLARIQAAAGLAQQQPEKLQPSLTRIERESQRISDLVGELLALSRLEAGISGSNMQEIDLCGLLEEIVANVSFEAEQRLVLIRTEGLREMLVTASGELLRRAIENVLRNAVQHCRNGGEVDVTSDFDNKTRLWHLRIDDQGPGVAESDLTEIFQPYFRGGNSEKHQSVGLGLAIAKRAILAHDGKIKACNRPEGGLRVDMEILFTE
ncbi:HAMP domain-containing protein [Candidatus Methylospira mobilis]|uniref:histidine kinase n=1 Tax=Candidatus Methylospira mobilis TaxID=1808979 RepID=A0A5Q0BLM9_9GAMM|nr:ATP-binding protein [Candidatus Methylospira mobilis]QFY44743.1 HAMP domain-containing protein [Candidatus Methylospira mobilis]